MLRSRAALVWAAASAAVAIPFVVAAWSPLLEWRDWIYIAAGFAGIAGMGLILFQPLLIGGYLPGLSLIRRRRAHRWVGGALVAAVAIHVLGLWYTSPPDMIDALLFRSPTPFSPFGVIATGAILAVAALAAFRWRLPLRQRTWRLAHMALAVVIVACVIAHAVLIEGAMETITKTALCLLIAAATVKAMIDLRVWRRTGTSRSEPSS